VTGHAKIAYGVVAIFEGSMDFLRPNLDGLCFASSSGSWLLADVSADVSTDVRTTDFLKLTLDGL
jgi:hypothetical protein